MLHCVPVAVAFILVIFGSVPVKLAYLVCHGRLAVRIVALPLMQGVPSVALVIRPVRAPATFAIVLEWNDPSIVSAHSVVPNPPLKSTLANVALIVELDDESLVADAVATSVASSAVAAITAKSTFPAFIAILSPDVVSLLRPLLQRQQQEEPVSYCTRTGA